MLIAPQHLLSWLAALRLRGVGPATLRRWLALTGNIQTIFSATANDLKELGFSQNEIELIATADKSAAEKDAQWLQDHNCHFIIKEDDHYPPLLRQVSNAPLALFVKGDASLLSEPQIAMVGSRTPTSMGYETAMRFAKELSNKGWVVTSGMALGIDAASHRGALLVGKTVAVMGAGLDHIYPLGHRKLADEILAQGAWVSEFLPGEMAKPRNFPLRNRIISGLSLGVLVVEAALRSGSLITAQDALEQGREVLAIPGSIHNPLARGCHYLLRQGAKLVETAADVLEELQGFAGLFLPKEQIRQTSANRVDLDENQQKIYAQIGYETTAIDTIIVRSGLTASEVSSILLTLELKGCAQTVPGGYVLTSRKPA